MHPMALHSRGPRYEIEIVLRAFPARYGRWLDERLISYGRNSSETSSVLCQRAAQYLGRLASVIWL